MQFAGFQLPGEKPAANIFIIEQQIERHIFHEKFHAATQRLRIERMQQRMPGAVGDGAGAVGRAAFAVIGRLAAIGALVDCAAIIAGERHAHLLPARRWLPARVRT